MEIHIYSVRDNIIVIMIILYPSKSAPERLYTLEMRIYPQMFGGAHQVVHTRIVSRLVNYFILTDHVIPKNLKTDGFAKG